MAPKNTQQASKKSKKKALRKPLVVASYERNVEEKIDIIIAITLIPVSGKNGYSLEPMILKSPCSGVILPFKPPEEKLLMKKDIDLNF